ncbi:MAG: cyclic nucleotide-binding domain-containing protein [Oscillospiraceae bacterium]|nr:cyclic nucleotide-binding domain-containing protein [Oscillospiraceae bacterium]
MMKQFKEDDIIVKQGDISDEMYKIVYGKAAVFINHGEKNEHLIGILAEQKCFNASEHLVLLRVWASRTLLLPLQICFL